jgi:hypothetical protein
MGCRNEAELRRHTAGCGDDGGRLAFITLTEARACNSHLAEGLASGRTPGSFKYQEWQRLQICGTGTADSRAHIDQLATDVVGIVAVPRPA